MNAFRSILALLPLLIHGAEQLHGPGNGEAKAATVTGAVMNIAAALLPQEQLTAVNNGVRTAVDGMVQVLNAAGALPKPVPPAAQ